MAITKRGVEGRVLPRRIEDDGKGTLAMYTEIDFQTKKALKEAVARGDKVMAYQPGGVFPGTSTGTDTIEGPHYPKPHKWYARVRLENYQVVKVLR